MFMLHKNNNILRYEWICIYIYIRIEQDKIGDASVKSKEDEIWTKALKYILIDLRCIAIHVTDKFMKPKK